MGRVVAGKASGIKLFCQNMQMHYDDKSILDQLRPGLPMTASGVALQVTCGNYGTAGLSEKQEKERRKASEEASGTVEGEMHTCKGRYLKYRNNNWKGERMGRHDGVKECRYTVPTGNKVERE